MRIHVTGSSGWIGNYCMGILKDKTVPLPATHLLHLAWDVEPGYWNRESNIDCFLKTNQTLARFFRGGGKRVLVAGTCANIDSTLYGRCKYAVKMTLDAYQKAGFSTAYARIHYLYGPGEQPQRLIPSIIAKIKRNEPIHIDHPYQILDYLYVKDVAGALCAILESDEEGSIDVGSGENVTTLEVARKICDLMGRDRYAITYSDLPSVERIEADTRRLSNIYAPKWTFEEGLKETIEAMT